MTSPIIHMLAETQAGIHQMECGQILLDPASYVELDWTDVTCLDCRRTCGADPAVQLDKIPVDDMTAAQLADFNLRCAPATGSAGEYVQLLDQLIDETRRRLTGNLGQLTPPAQLFAVANEATAYGGGDRSLAYALAAALLQLAHLDPAAVTR